MFSILSNALRHTLYASALFEVLHVGQLLFISFFFPKTEAATFALFVCTTALVGKGLDSGLGAASPRLLKIFPPPLLVQLAFLQAIPFLFLVSAICWFFYPSSLSFFIILGGIGEALSSFGRHALYSTLHGARLAYAEVAIKALKVISLPLIYFLSTSSLVLILHSIFFSIINTLFINMLFYRKVVSLHPGKPDPHVRWRSLHFKLLTNRLQAFSIKIGKDLLSTYVLTPFFFATTHNVTYTWIFFFFTTLVTSLQTIIKMTIAYTASGAFSNTPSTYHHDIRRSLNKILWVLLAIAFSILFFLHTSSYYFFTMPPQAITTAHCLFYFALLGFTDLFSLVEEQHLLIKGAYTYYQRARFIEYGITATLLFFPIFHALSLPGIALSLVLIKIILLIFLAARSSLLTKPAAPAPIFTPPVSPPPQGIPPAHTHEPTSPQAPAQKEGRDGGVPGRPAPSKAPYHP